MRPILPPLIALFIAVGCQPEPEPAPAADQSRTEVSRPSPAPETVDPSEPAGKPQSGLVESDNPSRLYQLRDLKRGTIRVNGKPVPVWIMDTPGKRQEGMMFLTEKDVKPDEGMLFVFPSEQGPDHGFWMRNTYLPLDIVYITKAGKVVRVAEGRPRDETSLPANGTFQYVLEMRQGAAKRYNLKAGSRIDIPAALRIASE